MDTLQSGLTFSKMKKYDVLDPDGKKIGHIGDVLIRLDDLSVHSFIIYGTLLEETMEELNLIDDIDEIVPINQIDLSKKDNHRIHTKLTAEELENTNRKWDPPDGLILFSKIKHMPVKYKTGVTVGIVSDLIFLSSGEFSLIISPPLSMNHMLSVMNIYMSNKIFMPTKYITEISQKKIVVRKSSSKRSRVREVSLLSLIEKGIENFEDIKFPGDKIHRRYHYVVMETAIENILRILASKVAKLSNANALLKFKEFDSTDDNQIDEFVDLYNAIALSSVDPYEEMSREKLLKYFSTGSYLAYAYNKPVGYCIVSYTNRDQDKIGTICGIGIHHKFRGKRFSSALLNYVVTQFKQQGINFIQSDVLVNNEASLALFSNYGFDEIDDFYIK